MGHKHHKLKHLPTPNPLPNTGRPLCEHLMHRPVAELCSQRVLLHQRRQGNMQPPRKVSHTLHRAMLQHLRRQPPARKHHSVVAVLHHAAADSCTATGTRRLGAQRAVLRCSSVQPISSTIHLERSASARSSSNPAFPSPSLCTQLVCRAASPHTHQQRYMYA
jgi:hypothetical protein